MGHLVQRFGQVVPGEVLDARAQADAILVEAQRRAEALMENARAQAAAMQVEAQQAGMAAGRAEAEATFTTLLVEARADAERVHAAAIPAARTLSMRMAEKIVGRIVQLEPAVLADIAAAALAAARARAGLVLLRVHPDDLATLEAARPVLASRLASAVELRVIADPSVAHAGCVVETPAGRLDARLETQLAALERAAFGDGAVVAMESGVRDG